MMIELNCSRQGDESTRQRKKEMTKELKNEGWPKTWVSACTWIDQVKADKSHTFFCEEDADKLSIHRWESGNKGHSQWDARRSSRYEDETFDGLLACSACGKNLTMLKPNPYAIPEVPTREDVKKRVHFTRALDEVFNSSLYFAKSEGIDIDEVHKGYQSYNENMTLTWARVQTLLNVFTAWKMSGTMDKTDARNLPRLEKLILESFQEGLIDASYERDKIIAQAREAAKVHTFDTYTMMPRKDRNRGMFYIDVYNVTPQKEGEQEWAYKNRIDRAIFRQEVDVYIDVIDGEVVEHYCQDVYLTSSQKTTNIQSTSIQDAIAEAKVQLQLNIDAAIENARLETAYAREALDDAGLSYEAESLIVGEAF
jgi:hypothetical protein